MADAAVQEQGRAALGRNQMIACVGAGSPLVMSYALVWADKVTGSEWLSWAQVYVPVALGIVLGVAGAVKAVQALRQ